MGLGNETGHRGLGTKPETKTKERTPPNAPRSSRPKRRPAHAKHLRRVHERRLRLRDVRDAVHAHAHGRQQAVPVEDPEERGARVGRGLDDAHGVPEGHVGGAVPAAVAWTSMCGVRGWERGGGARLDLERERADADALEHGCILQLGVGCTDDESRDLTDLALRVLHGGRFE